MYVCMYVFIYICILSLYIYIYIYIYTIYIYIGLEVYSVRSLDRFRSDGLELQRFQGPGLRFGVFWPSGARSTHIQHTVAHAIETEETS